ncbi:DUF4003 family protein [Metabacillus iocasae]|uniref:DUF4003 domain-containing protein n=1 Tax=Priestia iocasae TaxID=2291674 RepID=A0ABS2QZ46_9BACI|nr:DUF4003 family protein [Metabacillus iocasae]MBM7703729.1 hypothetical protein [Metabacillus iocasae]
MSTYNEKVTRYEEIYTMLKKKFKWSLADSRTFMMVASMYVVNKRDFDLERYSRLSDYIKNEVGTFSTLKSQERFTIAAMLDIRTDYPQQAFQPFIRIYEEFVQEGFSRNIFTYLSALILMTNESHNQHYQPQIERALQVYKGMRKNHFFLTSHSDYPLAVLLAAQDKEIDPLLQHVETLYNQLHANGFKKGNDLQFLSHILSLIDNQNRLVERTVELQDRFKQSGFKIKTMHYPSLGLMTLLDHSYQEIDKIQHVTALLNKEKAFKWYKDINFMMATSFVLSEQLDDTSLLETKMYTIMETILQAQQTAMMGTLIAASAASSSEGGA